MTYLKRLLLVFALLLVYAFVAATFIALIWLAYFISLGLVL